MKRSILLLMIVVALGACSEQPTASDSEPAVEVEGAWEATLSASDFKRFDQIPAKDWAGTWTLTIEEDRYSIEASDFPYRVTEQWSISGDEFSVTATPAPTGAFNCYDDDGERLLDEGTASAEYRVTLDDSSLSFEAIEEPCELRAAILERTWAEV